MFVEVTEVTTLEPTISEFRQGLTSCRAIKLKGAVAVDKTFRKLTRRSACNDLPVKPVRSCAAACCLSVTASRTRHKQPGFQVFGCFEGSTKVSHTPAETKNGRLVHTNLPFLVSGF